MNPIKNHGYAGKGRRAMLRLKHEVAGAALVFLFLLLYLLCAHASARAHTCYLCESVRVRVGPGPGAAAADKGGPLRGHRAAAQNHHPPQGTLPPALSKYEM